MVPGNSATVLVALAAIGGSPTRTMIGKETNEPPPATAFIVPAIRPARTRREKCSIEERYCTGTFCSSSASQMAALPSDGARQSPRGERDPPAETLGPFGIALRLNWLKAKNRVRKTCIQ